MKAFLNSFTDWLTLQARRFSGFDWRIDWLRHARQGVKQTFMRWDGWDTCKLKQR